MKEYIHTYAIYAIKDPLAMIKMLSFRMKGKDYIYYGRIMSDPNVFNKKDILK